MSDESVEKVSIPVKKTRRITAEEKAILAAAVPAPTETPLEKAKKVTSSQHSRTITLTPDQLSDLLYHASNRKASKPSGRRPPHIEEESEEEEDEPVPPPKQTIKRVAKPVYKAQRPLYVEEPSDEEEEYDAGYSAVTSRFSDRQRR